MTQSQETPENNTLYYADFGYPETLEPLFANKPSEHRLCQFLFDSLVVPGTEGDFIFSLAKDLDISPDGLSYTFILREDIKWSDNNPLTTRDVEFTVGLMLNPKSDYYRATLSEYIEDIYCVNPRIITITLSKPFYRPLALFTFRILPKHKFTTNDLKRTDSFGKNPVGCGPFQYESRQEREFILSANPLFSHRRSPFIKKVVVRIYDRKKEATNDLLDKKIHLVTEVDPSDIPRIEKSKDIVLKRYRTHTIHFIAFNHRHQHPYYELFRDYRFRRALLHSLDRKSMLNIFFGGGSTRQEQSHAVISGPFPMNSWAYDDTIQPLDFNLPYARELLKEVLIRKGYHLDKDLWYNEQKKNIELTLKHPLGDHSIEQVCRNIAENFSKLGILVKAEGKSDNDLLSEVWLQHSFDLVYTTYNFDNTFDVFPLFDASRIGKGQSNFSGYVDSKLMELFYEMRNTLNPWNLRSLSHKIHKIIHEESVHLFLWQLDLYVAYRQNLKFFELHPYYLFHFPENWKIVLD